MVKDAELHAEEDKKAHELADARNQADSMVHSVKEVAGRARRQDRRRRKAAIEAAIKEGRGSSSATATRTRSSQDQALAMQRRRSWRRCTPSSRQPVPRAAGASQPGGSEGDVVDAEFTEVKDNRLNGRSGAPF